MRPLRLVTQRGKSRNKKWNLQCYILQNEKSYALWRNMFALNQQTDFVSKFWIEVFAEVPFLLTHFSLMFHFYTLWKCQKTKVFNDIFRGIEMEHWFKMG